jgi:hypothetical protein
MTILRVRRAIAIAIAAKELLSAYVLDDERSNGGLRQQQQQQQQQRLGKDHT